MAELPQRRRQEPAAGGGQGRPKYGEQCPTHRCNLVMKGGVTSGVIFPGSIAEFATVYRFEQLGGTSAGAIAAALAAAAEYRRRESQTSNKAGKLPVLDIHDGFDKLWKISDELGEKTASGTTKLQALFAPNTSTQSLYELIVAASHKDRVPLRVGVALLRWYTLPTIIALLGLGLVLFALVKMLLWRDLSGPVMPAYLAGSLLLTLGVVSLFISVLLLGKQRIEANDMGLSRAFEPKKSGRKDKDPRFTNWMHDKLHKISGAEILTFGLLSPDTYKVTTNNRQDRGAGQARVPDERDMHSFRQMAENDDITLRQVTTCLSYGRPYVFPLDPESTDANHFYFKPDEWSGFFPKEIIEHLKRTSNQQVRFGSAPDPQTDQESDWDYYLLPPAQDLPVLVATRLSMSFPGLFSAVPLYGPGWSTDPTLDSRQAWARNWFGAGKERQCHFTPGQAFFQRLYFGDGGLTSNFPISLFDELAPCHPTFALNLEYPAAESDVLYDGNARLIPPDRLRVYGEPDQLSDSGWTPVVPNITTLFGYAMSIMESSRNWTDNAMIPLPGYSERIAHIKVGSGQGGLNLTMTKHQITDLRQSGRQAAKLLIARFHPDFCGPDPEWSWEIHQAMNLITLSADLEMLAQQYVLAYSDALGKLNVPALYKIKLQNGSLFPGDHPFNESHLEEFIRFGNQPTTLRGFRKLRGKRGVLRYRPVT